MKKETNLEAFLDSNPQFEFDQAISLVKGDILGAKLSEVKQEELVRLALECGQEYAKWYLQLNKVETNIVEIARSQNIDIEWLDSIGVSNVVIFGQYTPPRKITLNKHAIATIVTNAETYGIEHLTFDVISNIILGHELYHWVEEQFEEEIFTRTHQEVLWKFLGFQMKSRIGVLAEVAAMEFSRCINDSNISSYVMNQLINK